MLDINIGLHSVNLVENIEVWTISLCHSRILDPPPLSKPLCSGSYQETGTGNQEGTWLSARELYLPSKDSGSYTGHLHFNRRARGIYRRHLPLTALF
jgi:hypothetical protein